MKRFAAFLLLLSLLLTFVACDMDLSPYDEITFNRDDERKDDPTSALEDDTTAPDKDDSTTPDGDDTTAPNADDTTTPDEDESTTSADDTSTPGGSPTVDEYENVDLTLFTVFEAELWSATDGSAELLAIIPAESEVHCTKRNAYYCYVTYDGQEGYIARRRVTGIDILAKNFTPVEGGEKIMYVSTPVNVRRYPSSELEASVVIVKLEKGTAVTVISTNDEWSRIEYRTEDGIKYYFVFSGYLSEEKQTNPEDSSQWAHLFVNCDPHLTLYTTGNVHLRTAPSTEADSIKTIPAGSKVTVMAQAIINETGWSRVSVEIQPDAPGDTSYYLEGYMATNYLAPGDLEGGGSVVPPVDVGDGVQYPDVVNMGYYQYNAYVRGTVSGNGSFYCEDFWVDPVTGGADALSYSVIQRNNEIEKTYKCKIVQTWSTEYNMYSEMTTFFNVDKKFELAILVASDAATCAINGMLSDLKSSVNAQYMNLDNPAFDQNSIGQLTLGDNLYFLSGDMNISAMDCTMATVFNVEYFNSIADGLVETLGDEMYGDVYQMVEDGNWTLSNMLKMADAVVVDVDSTDGGLSFDKGDTIGYFQYFASPLYYYYAAGMRITTNEGGYPVFTITGEEEREVYEYIFDSLNIHENTMLPSGYSAERALNFLSGQVLFTDYILWDIRRVLYPAEANVYYGILPNPVINEGDDYHSLVYFETTVHLWSIPYKRANAEYSARMFEVMAAYSAAGRDSTMDAYYIKTMYMNVARDDGSRASLDIIRGSLVYDIALMYSHDYAGDLWGNFDDLLLNAASTPNYQYDAFTGESQMTIANKQLQDTIDAFMAMSGR